MLKKPLFPAAPLAMIVMLLTLVGCGGPTAQAPAQITPQSTAQSPAFVEIDACTLLTKADATQIMGNPVNEPTHPVQGTQTFYVDSCEYNLTGGTPVDDVTLTLEIPVNGDLATAQQVFNAGKQQAQAAYSGAPLDVTGVGDAAYWVSGEGNTLMVMKGMFTFSLSASTHKGDAPSQAMLDLAKTVAGRLP
jgi:hypothetical protein